MSKMSIADAALKLGVSKEAIHNRIRRGSLEVVVEDGVKCVILNQNAQPTTKTTQRRTNTKRVALHADAKYYKLLEEQNAKLQMKVEKLEVETKSLRDQKEEMLIQERVRIEQIYKDKDEQLKNILTTISSKFLLSLDNNESDESIVEDKEHIEVEIEAEEEEEVLTKLVSLKNYIKDNNFSKKRSKKIKDKFKKIAKKESRIIKVGKKYYINPSKYDYSDLLN
ncbi:MAG: DNA-binding protein [Campylobacterota bacterium]|nr:DNA-binding protein [Campylobacterota bacterium]